MPFNAIRENRVLAKTSEFTVYAARVYTLQNLTPKRI